MGAARRIAELYRAKVNALLDRAEDPREMFDYSDRTPRARVMPQARKRPSAKDGGGARS
jgi:phage shock protein A